MFQNGCAKNFLLIELSDRTTGSTYEIVEEFKGHSIARSMLRGIYRDRLKALASFKRVVEAESMTRVPLRHLALS